MHFLLEKINTHRCINYRGFFFPLSGEGQQWIKVVDGLAFNAGPTWGLGRKGARRSLWIWSAAVGLRENMAMVYQVGMITVWVSAIAAQVWHQEWCPQQGVSHLQARNDLRGENPKCVYLIVFPNTRSSSRGDGSGVFTGAPLTNNLLYVYILL